MDSSDDDNLLISADYDRAADEEEDDDGVDDDSYLRKIEDNDPHRDTDYVILTENDIRRRQDDAIAAVSSVLSVSKAASCLLLRRNNWSPLDVYDVWFADEGRARKAVGLISGDDDASLNQFSSVACGICFDRFSTERIHTAGCGHPFCESCWRLYIRTSVSDGPGCLGLRCPEPSCGGAAVGLDMIETLAAVEDKKKYDRFLFRSYIEENKKCKWCPFPSCSYAVEYAFESDTTDYSVTCNCSHSFCWKCEEESHRPVDCQTAANWIEKNVIESDNTRWILAFTKPCPKCKRPIEKNSGCNRMTCRPPCGFGFCWLCLSDWDVHGYKACNGYKATEESRSNQETAQKYLRKYTHYYERWASNDMSKQKAISDLQRMKDEHAEELIESKSGNKMIGGVVAAWKQIIECRRILKWSYVYGYYLLDTETTKKQLFEYLQGQAESALERLHQFAEEGLAKYLKKGGSSESFSSYRMELKGLTNTTRTYFENLAKAFENGLSEVDSCAKRSKRKAGKGGKEATRPLKRVRSSINDLI